ncbi:hypothetical protein NLG97_g7995 [Lecanicillium saksenae]|uniref:Uncharacterized protein n=1 Tax=Lecanicillium saksenae TaxID=468837 RepID=A0ACC1QMR9_9HYPO|nr:hypothetical protein NLG97_g7995 [Lecanicillium saksenae]
MVLQYCPENIPEGFIFMEHLTNGDGPMQVRKLANLRRMRHVIITGEASSHSAYDIVTMRFMNQAGLMVDCGFLERYGTHGNGHLMFLETNSDNVATCVMRWIQTKAGHIDTPVAVVEPEVTILSHQTAKSPPEIINLDEEPKRSPKRARTDSIPALAEGSKPQLVDLTGYGQMTTTICANQNLHNHSEGDLALSFGCKRIPPGMMPPPPSRLPTTSTVKAKPPVRGRVKLECQDSPPQRLVSFTPKADSSGVPASIHFPDNATPQKKNGHLMATRQRESGNVQQEAAQDGSFTSYRFHYSSNYPQNQNIGQDMASSGQHSSNPPEATPRQMPLMLPEASPNNYGMQFNPYMGPMQIASTSSIPANQVPRSVPSFPLPADPLTGAPSFQQNDVFMSADPSSQLDDMPTDFEYDFSCFDGMTDGELKSFAESWDFTAAWQG